MSLTEGWGDVSGGEFFEHAVGAAARAEEADVGERVVLKKCCQNFDVVGEAVAHKYCCAMGMEQRWKFVGFTDGDVSGGEAVEGGEAGAGVEDVDRPG